MRTTGIAIALAAAACGAKHAAPATAIEAHAESYPELRARLAAAKAGDERVLAEAALATALWGGSCPVAGEYGLCVERREAPAAATRCASVASVIAAVGRGEDGEEAASHFEEVLKGARGDSMSADVAEAAAAARLSLADGKAEAFFAAAPPGDLDLSQESGGQRMQQWLLGAMEAARGAREAYLAIVADDKAPAATRVLAIARIGELSVRLSDMLLEMPVPETVVSAGPEALDAFCDTLTEYVEPFAAQADEAWKACVERADALGVSTPIVDHCRQPR